MEQGAHRQHHPVRHRSRTEANPMNQALDYPEIAIQQDEAPVTPNLTAAWWAVAARFFLHGLVISTWVSRIPAIKTALHLNDGVFGFTLLGSAIGSIIGIPVSGWIVTRYGSRSASIWTGIGLCLALLPIVFAHQRSHPVHRALSLRSDGGLERRSHERRRCRRSEERRVGKEW